MFKLIEQVSVIRVDYSSKSTNSESFKDSFMDCYLSYLKGV